MSLKPLTIWFCSLICVLPLCDMFGRQLTGLEGALVKSGLSSCSAGGLCLDTAMGCKECEGLRQYSE